MNVIRFEVREEHLKLLRAAYVGWDGCEYGAPAIDCKRPYGNGDVPDDIRRVLGLPSLSDEDCRELHEATKEALQIVLRTGRFEPGFYVADKYTRDWKPQLSDSEQERRLEYAQDGREDAQREAADVEAEQA